MSDGLRIDIDASAVVDLAAAWERSPEMIAAEITGAVLEAELYLEREVRDLTPTAHGTLRESIAAQEPKRLSDQVIGVVGTSLAYAIPVELGTRPHFPPIAALADWAHYKLGVPADQAERVGFLIARKIAQRGTTGAAMFQRAFDRGRAQVERIFGAALQRIADRLAAAGGPA